MKSFLVPALLCLLSSRANGDDYGGYDDDYEDSYYGADVSSESPEDVHTVKILSLSGAMGHVCVRRPN